MAQREILFGTSEPMILLPYIPNISHSFLPFRLQNHLATEVNVPRAHIGWVVRIFFFFEAIKASRNLSGEERRCLSVPSHPEAAKGEV